MNNEFKSRQVYPEGNNPACIIEFFLPQEAHVTLSILSEHGKNFEHVFEKVKFDPGRHEVEVQREQYAGNVCFYRLAMQTQQQEIVDTKKIFTQAAND